MSTLVERPKARSGAGTAISGTLPQVNLLPPEVRAARGLRTTKRWLLIGLGVTAVVAVGIYGLALLDRGAASSELTQAQDRTSTLQAEQSKYAEVPMVLGALGTAQSARQLGMATDIDIKAYTDGITAVLPANVSIEDLSFTVATATTPPAGTVPVGQGPSVGQVSFTGRSSTVPDTAAWVDALNSVPGFANAWVSAVTIGEDETGIFYQVMSSVQLTAGALSHSYDPKDGEG